jgi:hypothetical protein
MTFFNISSLVSMQIAISEAFATPMVGIREFQNTVLVWESTHTKGLKGIMKCRKHEKFILPLPTWLLKSRQVLLCFGNKT